MSSGLSCYPDAGFKVREQLFIRAIKGNTFSNTDLFCVSSDTFIIVYIMLQNVRVQITLTKMSPYESTIPYSQRKIQIRFSVLN